MRVEIIVTELVDRLLSPIGKIRAGELMRSVPLIA